MGERDTRRLAAVVDTDQIHYRGVSGVLLKLRPLAMFEFVSLGKTEKQSRSLKKVACAKRES